MQTQEHISNTADPKQVKKAGIKDKMRNAQETDDIFSVMSTKEGRRFMYRLINEICHYDSAEFHSSGSLTYYQLGERNVGRLIKSDAYVASVKLYQLMEQENWEFLKGDNNK